jgi:hypothetical protein
MPLLKFITCKVEDALDIGFLSLGPAEVIHEQILIIIADVW